MKEAEIQRAILRTANGIPGVLVWRNSVGQARFGPRFVNYGVGGKGGSDLIGCAHGRFVALEVKTSTGRTSPEQDAFIETVRANGGFACVVRSTKDAVDALERCSKGAVG